MSAESRRCRGGGLREGWCARGTARGRGRPRAGGGASGLDSKLSRGRPRESLFAGHVVGRVRASEGGADAYLGPSGDPLILRGGDLRREETGEASAHGRVARERPHTGSPTARMLLSAAPGRVSNEAMGGNRETRAGGRRTWTGWSYLTSELMGGIGMMARRRSRPPVLPSPSVAAWSARQLGPDSGRLTFPSTSGSLGAEFGGCANRSATLFNNWSSIRLVHFFPAVSPRKEPRLVQTLVAESSWRGLPATRAAATAHTDARKVRS